MRLMATDSVAAVAAVAAGRRLTDGRTIGPVGQLVQTASIAQIVIVAVATPKRRSNCATIGAFSALQHGRIIC